MDGGLRSEARLHSDAQRGLVEKRIPVRYVNSFLREVRALAKVRGIDGVQQIEAVVILRKYVAIISVYSGSTLGTCIEELTISPDQLERVIV